MNNNLNDNLITLRLYKLLNTSCAYLHLPEVQQIEIICFHLIFRATVAIHLNGIEREIP